MLTTQLKWVKPRTHRHTLMYQKVSFHSHPNSLFQFNLLVWRTTICTFLSFVVLSVLQPSITVIRWLISCIQSVVAQPIWPSSRYCTVSFTFIAWTREGGVPSSSHQGAPNPLINDHHAPFSGQDEKKRNGRLWDSPAEPHSCPATGQLSVSVRRGQEEQRRFKPQQAGVPPSVAMA